MFPHVFTACCPLPAFWIHCLLPAAGCRLFGLNMLRRRRPLKNEAIHFSFDSFLDLVTNVVGIIIRLILVTWVGARSYHAGMQWIDGEAASHAQQKPAPKASDDPLATRLEASKRDLDDAKTRLLEQLKELDEVEDKTKLANEQLIILAGRRDELEKERKSLESKGSLRGVQLKQASLSSDEVRQRSKKLLEEIKRLEAMPSNKQQLKYHAPVSRVVQSEELNFECKNGRVTYIDMPAFMAEIKAAAEDVKAALQNRLSVERTTSTIGPYRLRYVYERSNGMVANGTFGLSSWEVVPIAAERGETLQQALAAKSDFRQLTDALDPRLTVVTFWVYPDSFELFRRLRDQLYERGLDIAGRPLPPGSPIAASRNGTASRGQ